MAMCTLKLGLNGDKYSQRKNIIVKPKKGTKPHLNVVIDHRMLCLLFHLINFFVIFKNIYDINVLIIF